MTRPILAAIAAGSVLLAGCTATPITDRFAPLRDNTVTRFLGPDAPSDSVLATSWSIDAAPVQFDTANAGDLQDQRLHIGGQATLSVENHPVPDGYRIVWKGQRASHAAEPTRITLRDASGARALVVMFEEERLRVLSAGEEDFPLLTYAVDTTHTVVADINMSIRPTVAIDIREGRKPIYTMPPRPVLDSGFRGLSQIEVAVGPGQTTYHMSGIEITEVTDG